jgi:hypothetical protein
VAPVEIGWGVVGFTLHLDFGSQFQSCEVEVVACTRCGRVLPVHVDVDVVDPLPLALSPKHGSVGLAWSVYGCFGEPPSQGRAPHRPGQDGTDPGEQQLGADGQVRDASADGGAGRRGSDFQASADGEHLSASVLRRVRVSGGEQGTGEGAQKDPGKFIA